MLSHHDFSSPCETAPAFRGQSCAGRTLQPFFGVVGTFVSSLCAASLLRALLRVPVCRRAILNLRCEDKLALLPPALPRLYTRFGSMREEDTDAHGKVVV